MQWYFQNLQKIRIRIRISIRGHTNNIKFLGMVTGSFIFCYGVDIPLAPFWLVNSLVHLYSVQVLISTYLYLAVKHCRIQVSENTFVDLFELHDYYCIHYLMSTYIHVIIFLPYSCQMQHYYVTKYIIIIWAVLWYPNHICLLSGSEFWP